MSIALGNPSCLPRWGNESHPDFRSAFPGRSFLSSKWAQCRSLIFQWAFLPCRLVFSSRTDHHQNVRDLGRIEQQRLFKNSRFKAPSGRSNGVRIGKEIAKNVGVLKFWDDAVLHVDLISEQDVDLTRWIRQLMHPPPGVKAQQGIAFDIGSEHHQFRLIYVSRGELHTRSSDQLVFVSRNFIEKIIRFGTTPRRCRVASKFARTGQHNLKRSFLPTFGILDAQPLIDGALGAVIRQRLRGKRSLDWEHHFVSETRRGFSELLD